MYEILNIPDWLQEWSLVGHPVFVASEGYNWGSAAVLLAMGIAGAVGGAVLVERRDTVV